MKLSALEILAKLKSKRQDRPDAILWLCKNAPELNDGQISKLVGITKN